MKKIMLGMLVFATSNAMALANNLNLYGKVGADFVSKFESISPSIYLFSAPSKNTVSPNLFLELTYNVTPEIEFGVGSGYIRRKSYNYVQYGKTPQNFSGQIHELDIKEYSKVNRYSSIPLYLIGKYNFNIQPNLAFYIKGDLGYSFNKLKATTHHYKTDVDILGNGQYSKDANSYMQTSVTNGHYYGIGIGTEYKNLLAEIAYHHTSARLKYHTFALRLQNVSYDNDAVRFSIGYKF
ncbi:outer membrane beta-barrel protein [Pasteurella oralis]|uniref:Outer membrane beta-barrel protein n=1 Tax=Pasteurella oralis TaxID=1071947 RepID=A0ABW4NXU7_9PAST